MTKKYLLTIGSTEKKENVFGRGDGSRTRFHEEFGESIEIDYP